jgi:predicted nucleic acid-binding protein
MTSRSLRSVAADSNVLLSAVVGHAARRVFERVPRLLVVTTEANLAEVQEYLPFMSDAYGLDLLEVQEAQAALPVRIYNAAWYRSRIPEAKRYLQDRDPDDVALAALALKLQIPIWSNDRDFEGMPIEIYPTAKLLKALDL